MPTVTVIQPITADLTERKLRVAAYCRVSSNSDDQLNSYIAQVNYYSHKFEESETETLVDIYADEGITGTCETKRTEFLRLIDDCRRGKIDRIYVKSISRFARNTRDCLKNIRELKAFGMTVFFEKENIDTANITDELMITIMGGLAQEESVSISHNMRWSIRRRMQNGTFKAPSLPYGYSRANGEVIINQTEAEIVRFIYDSYLNGIGMESIANYLNQNTTKGKKGFIWCKNTVRYILTNEKYTGSALFQRFYTTNEFPFRQKENKGEREMYYTETAMPAIITKEVFEAVQSLHKGAQNITGHDKGGTYTYSRKIKCARCGATYRRKLINGNIHWTCTKHNLNAELCENMPIPETDIATSLIRLFNKLLFQYKNLFEPIRKSLQELEHKQTVGNTNVIELRRSILQLKEQLRVIAELRTKGFISEAKCSEQTAEINVRINKLTKDLRLLSHNSDDTLKDIEMLIDYFEKRDHIMIDFEAEAFEFLVDKIIVNGNSLEFHIMGGLKFIEKI